MDGGWDGDWEIGRLEDAMIGDDLGKAPFARGTRGLEPDGQPASGDVGPITRWGMLRREQPWHTSLAIASLF
jgi:hypothetical protein